MKTIEVTDRFAVINCCDCGTPFAVPVRFEQSLRETHQKFCCPNGHWQSFHGQTEEERLQKVLKQTERRLECARATATRFQDEAETAERKRRAAKGQLTKVKNRVSRGVCPCCNRSFSNLHDHMKSQHPSWTGE